MQNAEDDAKAALVAAEQQLHVLGVDKDHPTETVKGLLARDRNHHCAECNRSLARRE